MLKRTRRWPALKRGVWTKRKDYMRRQAKLVQLVLLCFERIWEEWIVWMVWMVKDTNIVMVDDDQRSYEFNVNTFDSPSSC